MDVSLPITGGGILLVITGFSIKHAISLGLQKAKNWDDHLLQCAEKNIDHARLEEKVVSLQTNQERIEGTVNKMDNKLDRLLEKN